MALLQQPIQRKLSSLLGAEVTFDKLNISLLGGTIDAAGVTVAGEDPAEPVLTIKRVLAKLALKRALAGEIVVTSLTIERPVLSVRRRSDGTTNLPRPLRSDAADLGNAPTVDEDDEPVATGNHEPAAHAPAHKRRWTFDVEQILLVDGQASLTCECAGGRAGDRSGADAGDTVPYEITASPILAELKRRDGSGDYALTFIADAIRRRDQPAEFGAVRMTGAITGAADLAQIARAGIEARLDIGETLNADVRVPSIAAKAGTLAARGTIDLAHLLALLPDAMRRRGLPVSGKVQLDASADFDAVTGLRVTEFNLRATDVNVPR